MKKIGFIFFIIVFALAVYSFLDRRGVLEAFSFGSKHGIIVMKDGERIQIGQVDAKTVCELLDEFDIEIKETDRIMPECSTTVGSAMRITVESQRILYLTMGEVEKEMHHYGDEGIPEIAMRHGIEIASEDIIKAEEGHDTLTHGARVDVTKVTREEVTEKERSTFQEIVVESEEYEVGFEEVKTEGIEGEVQIISAVTYHDGEEVGREEVSREITVEKIDRVVVKGTKEKELAPDSLELGKSHTGQASWYAYKGCDCAANPWLPKGSRVKVTAVNSGKSVILTINDRGPFVPGRIVDLDKTAFEKIAPLGAGVIDVKMEEVIE